MGDALLVEARLKNFKMHDSQFNQVPCLELASCVSGKNQSGIRHFIV